MKLAITSLGMITSVGHDVETACASIRAGLSRPSPTCMEILDEQEMESSYLSGYPISGVSDGFQGIGILARLGCRALLDLIKFGKLKNETQDFWSKTALLVCASKAKEDTLDILDKLIIEDLPQTILESTQIPISINNCHVFMEGHASVAFACQWATQHIKQGEIKRCIVLGVDSLVNEAAASYFSSMNRLAPDSPQGLILGEAAAALLLEDTQEAESRNAHYLACLASVSTGREEHHFLCDEPNYGRAVANSLLNVVPRNRQVHEIYSDLNGEYHRGMDWGHAVTIVTQKLGYFPSKTNIPAEAIGETGAASAAVAICAAVRSFARNYNIGQDILISSLADTGEYSSLLLTSSIQAYQNGKSGGIK